MNDLELIVQESDISDSLSTAERVALEGDNLSNLSKSDNDGRLTALSRAVSRTAIEQLSQMVPDDFQLSEVTLNIKLSGKAFGMEVGGTGSVKMVPRD